MTTMSLLRLRIVKSASMLFGLSALAACQDLTAKLPAGTVDPHFYRSAEAAQQMTRNSRYEFQESLLHFMLDAGRIADEFYHITSNGVGSFDVFIVLDSRYLPDVVEVTATMQSLINEASGSYLRLQRVRSRSSQARHALAAYAPESPMALQGEMVAYEAFAEIMLADLYCSGIPLSVVEFEGDFQYRPGSLTRQVYEHAIALFDTAIALAESDPSVRTLAHIGKGRALLALGRYAEAASAVTGVPEAYVFALPVMGTSVSAMTPNGVSWRSSTAGFMIGQRGVVANNKGGNGLNFSSANDPRIKILCRSSSSQVCESWIPQVQSHLIVANHIEARLIEAEAKAQADDAQFLTILNALRTDGTTTTDEGGVTRYGAGTGGVANLSPLADPGLASLPSNTTALDVRINLIMRERAFWLFFTGHRQGDLRRLLRHYDRAIESVYPQGAYPAGIGYYGQYVDVPIPSGELKNPFYTGCIGRGE